MNPLYLIPPIVIIAGVCYMVYMNAQHSKAKSEINLDQERSRYDIYKQELLTQDFAKLKQWMKDKPIDAFTGASVPQTTSNKLQEMLSDGLKNIALSNIGLKLRRVETDCFWVLSGKDLHFLSTDTEGDLDEHIIFDTFRIAAASLKYSGVLKSQLGVYSQAAEEYLPKVHLITFNIDDSPLSLEIHDRVNYTPGPADMLDMKKQLATRAKYQVVGEKLVDILQSRFSNLKTT